MSNDLLIPDSLFPADNELEIPTLMIDRQARNAAIPFVRFGEQTRTYDMRGGGTLHFYTDDYKFNSVYEHPEKILRHNPMNIVEPNFSLGFDTPVAFGLQTVYKKRWIARAMQEKGIGVFVDLYVPPKYYKLNLMGVPMGWSAFCTRGYSDRLGMLEFEYNMALAIARGNKLLFVVYGGGKAAQQFCMLHGCVYVTPTVHIKDRVKRETRFKELTESIAFLDMPSVDELVEQRAKLALSEQVVDYGKQLGK